MTPVGRCAVAARQTVGLVGRTACLQPADQRRQTGGHPRAGDSAGSAGQDGTDGRRGLTLAAGQTEGL